MFEYIRTHQRLMQLLLLIVIVPSFAFFGIESFTRSRGADIAVATVAGASITQQEFDSAQRNKMDRLREAYGSQFDAKIFNSPEAKQIVLDELIARKALTAEAKDVHLSIPDAVLQKLILSNPAFLKSDGSFDKNLYQQKLASQRMSPTSYEQGVRQDLVLQQLIGAVQETSFVPKTVAANFSSISEQEREIQSLAFKASDFASQVKITDDMLKAYYEKNSRLFEVPEVAKAEYLVLSSDALASQISVSDQEIQVQYEQNKKNYSSEEQRRASHILIDFKKDANSADKKAAKEKADSLLAELRKKPELFAKLAKENSKDPGSAQRGGDLDYFGRGAMVKPFDEAVFKLKTGEISDVVESDFGYHIIQLTAVKPAMIKSLAEVKEQIAGEIKARQLPKLFSEKAEAFRDAVDEQSDNLKAVADRFKLKLETMDHLSRQPNPSLPPNVATNNPKFLSALFSENSLKKKLATSAIDVGSTTLIAGHLLDYKAATKRPLDQVKAQIVAQVTLIESEALAAKAGEAKLKALKLADSLDGFNKAKSISRQKPENVVGSAFNEIFKANVQKLPAFVGIAEPTQGYVIYRISKFSAGVVDPAKRAAEQQQFTNAVAQAETVSYIEALKAKAKVTINKTALASSTTAGE